MREARRRKGREDKARIRVRSEAVTNPPFPRRGLRLSCRPPSSAGFGASVSGASPPVCAQQHICRLSSGASVMKGQIQAGGCSPPGPDLPRSPHSFPFLPSDLSVVFLLNGFADFGVLLAAVFLVVPR